METIRKAVKQDLAELVRLFGQVHARHTEAESQSFRPISDPDAQSFFLTLLDGESTHIYVAESDHHGLLGYCSIQIKDRPASLFRPQSRILSIEHMAVDSTARRQGLGCLFVQKIEQVATELDISRIELDCWEFNSEAVKFYESQGFRTSFRRMCK